MPTPISYSLSAAATEAAAACRTKKRRVSAQLSRLIGSPADDHSRRRASEDGIVAAPRNNNKSEAVAWMWHTQGIPQAAPHVLPTTSMQSPALVNEASSCIRSSNSRSRAGAINTRDLQDVQPSRFKTEASMLQQLHSSCCSSADQNHAAHESQGTSTPHHSAGASAHDTLHEEQPSEILYDEFELSCLQELLETEIVSKHSPKISAQQQQLLTHADIRYPSTYSASTTSSSSRQIMKPLSAIHKLIKRLYTRNDRNSAIELTGPKSTESGPRKLGSVQHVVHHHHHHYHYKRSLDLPAHESPPGVPTAHLHGFVTRRRRHSESCSEARRSNRIVGLDHLQVGDSLYAEAHHRPQRAPALFSCK